MSCCESQRTPLGWCQHSFSCFTSYNWLHHDGIVMTNDTTHWFYIYPKKLFVCKRNNRKNVAVVSVSAGQLRITGSSWLWMQNISFKNLLQHCKSAYKSKYSRIYIKAEIIYVCIQTFAPHLLQFCFNQKVMLPAGAEATNARKYVHNHQLSWEARNYEHLPF